MELHAWTAAARPCTGREQAGGRGLDAVVVDRRHVARAEPAFVHEAEVRHVEEVLDDARRAGRHVVGAAVELAQPRIVLRPRRPAARRPRLRAAPRPGRGPRAPHAPSRGAWPAARSPAAPGTCAQRPPARTASRGTGIRAPAAFARHHAAQRELRAAVRAAVGPGLHGAGGVAPQHDAFAQQARGERRVGHIVGQRHRMPELFFDHRGRKRKRVARGNPLVAESARADFLSPPGTLPSTPLT